METPGVEMDIHVPIEVCKRILTATSDAINAQAQLHFTLRMMDRVDKVNTFSQDVITCLEKSVVAFAASGSQVQKFYWSIATNGLNEREWNAFANFWKNASSFLTNQMELVVRSVIELIRREINHIWHFTGMFSLLRMFRPEQRILKEGTPQHAKMESVWKVVKFAKLYTTTCHLFLEVKPHLLNPWNFFMVADGIYYSIFLFFERVVILGASVDNRFLHSMAHTFAELGCMCPVLKLEFSDPDDAVRAARRTSKKPLNPTEIDKIKFLSKFKLLSERFHPASLNIADQLARSAWARCISDHYVLQLVEEVLEGAVRRVKSVYIEIRRIVYYILLKVFPRAELRDKIHVFLKNNMHIYFYDCIDLLKICKEHIDVLPELRPGNREMLLLAKLIFEDVHLPYKTLCNVLPDIIKEGLIEFVRSHYIATRDTLSKETAFYVINFARASAQKGCNPLLCAEVRTHYLMAIVTFKSIYNELQHAIDGCRDGMLIALEGTTKDNISIIYDNFRTAYRNIPETLINFDPKTILRKLPLTGPLRQAIVAEMGPVFDGTELDLQPYYRLNKIHFVRKDINLKSYVPPDQDILTEEQLKEYFK